MKLIIVQGWLATLLLTFSVGCGALPFGSEPFAELVQKRQATQDSLTVDLGYAKYRGSSNGTTGINTWRGIRFARPPVDSLRWQAPQTPESNRSSVIDATRYAPQCLQSPNAPNNLPDQSGVESSEDCLFLNINAPANASNLPVLVWIHGGGYGQGNGRQDLSSIIETNNNSFVGVSIQYRLGAFGFLASDEVARYGRPNAGILDQAFALQWVQAYIETFGGNRHNVTISGESAGGGSVMLHALAQGGSLGNSLFRGIVAASPYLPKQYLYKDFEPSQSYYAFAAAAGCFNSKAYGNSSGTIFECLTSQDSNTLQSASVAVSSSGVYATWGFLPVTDGAYVQHVPSQQLLLRKVNGERALIGNNGEEGPGFVPQDIKTEQDLINWLKLLFPLMKDEDISKLLGYYPVDESVSTAFASDGTGMPDANSVTSTAVGQQARADNIYAETTFVCPSYWMTEAYSGSGRKAYRYQYSIVPSLHAQDVTGYFGPGSIYQGPDFVKAFMTIWGNFVTTGDPSISSSIAQGTSSNNTVAGDDSTQNWPEFSPSNPYQINLNQTGGTETQSSAFGGKNITVHVGPGLQNNFTRVNAYTWEGGRGQRCDFWRSIHNVVPE
ncbi:alpha/beta-hydrolase [Testicularia cyperi]|uniref:Carboxylic ester hydrolase n=1 Tax=Testicularia cyperi TaxID=1882483 RepID=A0A317XHF7_9BASI|nr:alpha/beta-hydrolase [Testicularia cyperi]